MSIRKTKQIYKYKLCNEYLDKLAWSETHLYLMHLRTEARLSREELAYILGLSPGSIKRYESNWKQSSPPKWYELTLRFLCGDLSFFGDQWADSRIHPFDKRLRTHYCKHTNFLPRDMNLNYNHLANMAKNELREMQNRLDGIEKQNHVLKIKNAELEIEIEKLNALNERLRAHNDGIKSGKIVSLFGS